MLTIEAYQEKIDEWVRTHGVRYFSELTNTAILMEEVGEVARIMARSFGDQSFKRKLPRQADSLLVESSAFFSLYSTGVRSFKESCGRSLLLH